MDTQEFSEQSELPPITNPSLVLLLGPSGAGKSEVINRLVKLDNRILPNMIYTDRNPREDDLVKTCISPEEFTGMIERGEFLTWEAIYGKRYGERKR